MEKSLTPAEVRKYAPQIRVCSPQEGAKILTRQPNDAEYEAKEGDAFLFFIEGDGTRFRPYRYMGPAPVSPYYAIIDLWFRFRFVKYKVFIQVNDCILIVQPKGVIATSGHYTKFIP